MVQVLEELRLRDELVEAFHEADEARARALVSQLNTQPRRARSTLEAMLEDTDATVRQAAAFGLGELGGAASARRLERQLAIEEARKDHDGESVIEAITQALGRIEESSARASLARRLQRLTVGKPERSTMGEVARALWRRRHPELRPLVRSALERLSPPASLPVQGLLCLLEQSPQSLGVWAKDATVPVEHKTAVLTVLEEDVPDALLPTLSSFISAAEPLLNEAIRQKGTASYFCNRLFVLLLMHRERVLPALTPHARSSLRALARGLLASVDASCSLRAAVMLEHVGHSEDAALIEAHRPEEPVLAKVFDEAAQALRSSS